MFTELYKIIKAEIIKGNSVKSQSIINAISIAIEKKIIERNSRLPSVNESVKELSIARTTIVKAYKELIHRGVIESRPRYGYFVISEDTKRKIKVMLLLHNLNPFQEQLYNAFEKSVGDYASIEVYFHHCNIEVLENLILDKQNKFGLFVITPFTHSKMSSIISKIPSEKVLIIDQLVNLTAYSYICQNFNENIISAMSSLNEKFLKYNQGYLIFPNLPEFPNEIKQTFKKYATLQNLKLTVQSRFKHIQKNAFYIVMSEKDLVKIVKEVKNNGWELGKDIGILSYNDMPIKEIIADGITVISADFNKTGQLAGTFVKNRIPIYKTIETKIILRNSL